jgi:DnaK suppressor protein
MPAKKAASKKRKTTSRKKVSKKKITAKKKVAKKTVSRKKVSKKKLAKKAGKKTVAKKKVSKKKVATKKKATKKKVSKKKVSKKKPASKKTSKKASKKKAPAKTKAAKKSVSKKAISKKAASKKKVAVRTMPAAKKKTPARKKISAPRPRSRGNALSGPIHGIAPYKPARGEEYMSDEQIEHFREILSAWKNELMFEVDRTVHHMQDEAANFPDPNDRATQESEFGLELRTRDRERKLLRKIDSALARLDDGSYGFCDKTGEEIGLKRLEARPVATLSLEAQERREMSERQFRDRDDRYR